jgi:hypothetical protein
MCGIVVATDIHHVKPLREFPELKYELGNLRPLCHRCHSGLTAQGQ